MLRAIIFDFNGVILNDEPHHFRSMSEAFARSGVEISREEYYSKYLPMDDDRCVDAICRNHSVVLTDGQRVSLVKLKRRIYSDLLQGSLPFCDGVEDLIRGAAERYPLALASGASRTEITEALLAKDLLDCFRVIMGAEDFAVGKPAPESYLEALLKLNQVVDHARPVSPQECLVIEDSVAGVAGVRGAGMVCLAVANTYPPEKLAGANRVVASLREIPLESLPALFVRLS